MKSVLLISYMVFLAWIEKSSGQNFIAVKTSVTEYQDGNHPTANLSTEIYLGKKFSIQPAFGICFPTNYYDGFHQEGMTGRLELKKYWWWKDKYESMTGPYFSFEVFAGEFILFKESSYGQEYKQYIKTFRTHLKAGYQKKIAKHFVFDFFGGVGTKYKDYHQKHVDEGDDLQWIFRSRSYKTGWYPDLALGLRIGCIF